MMTMHARKAQLLARGLLESPEVVASVRRRLIEGTLPEEIELLLWELAYPPAGRPPGPASPTSRHTRPTLAFTAPLSADEVDARKHAAAFDGDVAHVATLTAYQEERQP